MPFGQQRQHADLSVDVHPVCNVWIRLLWVRLRGAPDLVGFDVD
jgi:hypothetical protein